MKITVFRADDFFKTQLLYPMGKSQVLIRTIERIREGDVTPLQYSFLENLMDRGGLVGNSP